MIGDIGNNHLGNMQVLASIVESASKAGFTYVKLQLRNPEKCVPDSKKDDIIKTPLGIMTYLEWKQATELSQGELMEFIQMCSLYEIGYSFSVWDEDSAELAKQLKPDFIKIPSALATDGAMLGILNGYPNIIASTGACTEKNIIELHRNLNKSYVEFMYCKSIYPTEITDLNLQSLERIRKITKCNVGYSGHEIGVDSNLIHMLIGMNCNLFERHIMYDKNIFTTDSVLSLDYVGMKNYIQTLKDAKFLLGKDTIILNKKELKTMEKLRK